MATPLIRAIFLGVFFFCVARSAETRASWQPTTWNGERALVAESSGWKAIVSLERGRLVYFSHADSDANLLFAPATRHDAAGWGGHRLWLGPQSTWSAGWPPPAAWEHSGAESFSQQDGVLRLRMPDAGDGWPQLTRMYRWNGDRLTCTSEINGGSRSVQFINIIQTPAAASISATASPGKIAPMGYVLLPSTATPRLTADFSPPPQVARKETALTLRHMKKVLKLGFVPQPFAAQEGGFSLTMSRVTTSGDSATEPDKGFFSQVYLGGSEPFIELEQLSPMMPAGKDASFVFEIRGEVR